MPADEIARDLVSGNRVVQRSTLARGVNQDPLT